MKKINNKKGFTLQELLITIGIIIITLAIAIPADILTQKKSYDCGA